MQYSLQTFLEANSAVKRTLHVENPVGVFLGGTSGIGEYSAYAFAKYTEAPRIYIAGRSEESGNRIVKKLKELNPHPNAKYEFVKTDAGLIKEDDRLCGLIATNEDKVNLVMTSPGYINFEGYKETNEGVNDKLAVHYYGRWRVIERLIPLLQQSAKRGEPARAITVQAAGSEGKIFEDDLDLKERA